MSRGYVLYKGRSMLDGRPIICVATMKTDNAKTGNMVQTWILREDVRPEKALSTGEDESVCGNCVFRPVKEGLCYVNVGQAPLAVYQAYRAGAYTKLDLRRTEHRKAFAGRLLRMGSYGEPTALPISIWSRLLHYVAGHTGYTHQWARFPDFRNLLMASVHSEFEMSCARAMGWRTFRSRHPDQPLTADEIVCPASPEGGDRRTCETCCGCNGGDPRRRSFSIVVHGKKGTVSKALKYHLAVGANT